MQWPGRMNGLGQEGDNMKIKELPLKLNLQYFAEFLDDVDGSGEEDTGADDNERQEETSGSSTEDDSNTEPTFDELLQQGHQAEFDRRLHRAIQKALKNQKEKYETLMDDKLSEVEKLSKMTKDEREKYISQKHERELAERETAITKRELMAEAKNTLAEKKLPVELAEVLNYTDADSCKESIQTVEKAFQKALEAAVEERLKGGRPPKRATEGIAFTKEQVNAMTTEEINKNWDSIAESMQTWK